MKKHLLFALGLAAACTFTACGGDDDDNGNVVSDFSGGVTVKTLPNRMASVLGNMGLTTYMFSDNSVDVFIYLNAAPEDNVVYNYFNGGGAVVDSVSAGNDAGEDVDDAVSASTTFPPSLYPQLANQFYGGFMPAQAFDEGSDEADYMNPITGSGNEEGDGWLVCNPGQYCRSFFTKNLTSPWSYAFVKKGVRAYVQAPLLYQYMAKAINDNDADAQSLLDAWDVKKLPANTRIEALVYGYVDHFSIRKFADVLGTLKEGLGNVSEGGCPTAPVALIETGADGKVTKLCDKWTAIEFKSKLSNDQKSAASSCYLYEMAIRVIDTTTGKTSATYKIEDNEMLNYVLVDDITFESRDITKVLDAIF